MVTYKEAIDKSKEKKAKKETEPNWMRDSYKRGMAKKMSPEVVAFVKSKGRHSEKLARKSLSNNTWNRKERGLVARTTRESWSDKIK